MNSENAPDIATDVAASLRILRPAPHILAFYDGRIAGKRLHSSDPNWLDDGGCTLGTCSYAIVSGAEALVYDTHMTLAHARRVRATLRDAGITTFRVVLSHHHLDHIAGNAVFADCEILANRATAEAMATNREAAESADPPIRPVVMPSRVFETDFDLSVGAINVQCLSFNIHSHDGLVLWLPETRQLFAGDTLEDTCTYVAEPDGLADHLVELDRMTALPIDRILPNHGDPEIIAAGGYGPGLIQATGNYVRGLLSCRLDAERAGFDLKDFVAADLAAGDIRYHPAYEDVHRRNVRSVLRD